MKLKLLAAQILALSFLCSGCMPPEEIEKVPTETIKVQAEETTIPPSEPILSKEEKILHSMSLRERVGQLFLIRPDALNPDITFQNLDNSFNEGSTFLSDSMKKTLQLYPVGGFVQFQKNIQNPDQIAAFNKELSENLYIPPFIAVDEEGGPVARLANSKGFSLPRFESPAALGAGGPEAAQDMGRTIGNYLHAYGFNMDFAPVADINTNPGNPVIGRRAFSSDPYAAADCARAMADGLRMNDVIPVFKHFPGHGDTYEDSHKRLAVNAKSEEELMTCEWIPFLEAEDREAIMIGHIALPEVTGNQDPATFSQEIVTGILKEKLGYKGLIITDSLSMGAIINGYDSGEAALNALNAGCHILLMPADLPQAFNAVLNAVESGALPEEKLDSIVLQILKVKSDYHLFD